MTTKMQAEEALNGFTKIMVGPSKRPDEIDFYGFLYKSEVETIINLLSGLMAGTHVIVPIELDRRLGEAMLNAMWPSGEIIHDDKFEGPEGQLSAGWEAMLAAADGEKK